MTSDEYHSNPSSPAGQIESVGAFASGLTHLSGWRRQAARWAVLLVLVGPLLWTIGYQLAR